MIRIQNVIFISYSNWKDRTLWGILSLKSLNLGYKKGIYIKTYNNKLLSHDQENHLHHSRNTCSSRCLSPLTHHRDSSGEPFGRRLISTLLIELWSRETTAETQAVRASSLHGSLPSRGTLTSSRRATPATQAMWATSLHGSLRWSSCSSWEAGVEETPNLWTTSLPGSLQTEEPCRLHHEQLQRLSAQLRLWVSQPLLLMSGKTVKSSHWLAQQLLRVSASLPSHLWQ